MSQKTISQIERGEVTARGRTVDALAEALGVPPMALFGAGEGHDAAQPLQRLEVPLYGDIPAGAPSAADPQQETFPVLRHLFAANRYCLRCEFDSMSPTIQQGDIILVEYRPEVEPELVQGRICACMVNRESTLKRLYVERRRGGGRRIILRGDNPDAEPIIVDAADEFSIQGVVLQIVSRQV